MAELATDNSAIRTLADIEEIKQLSHRYSRGLDTFDLEGILSVYTDDAVFDASGFELGKMEGRDQLRKFFGGSLETLKTSIHLIGSHIIDVDGDSAAGSCYLDQDGYTHEGNRVRCLGIYEDTYRRTDVGWKISSRKISPLVPFEIGDLEGI